LCETSVGCLDALGSRSPAATIRASYGTFMRINTAKLTVEKAVTEGRLRFEGDLAQMMEYADALNRFTEVRRTIPTEY
jgi:putative sterol carrier protein